MSGEAESLAEVIKNLEGRIRSDLVAAFDYYEHTIVAWRLVQRLLEQGRAISITSLATGTDIDGPTFAGLAQGYVTVYLAESVFQHLVSLFEDFTFGLIGAWLLAHPGGIPNKKEKKIDLDAIFEARDIGEIIRIVVDRELDDLKYKRPAAWFHYLEQRVKLGCPDQDQIDRLAEIKASRDVIVHNRGIVNETYLAKAGARARYAKAGDRLEIPEPYLRDGWHLIRDVVVGMSAAAIAKSRA